MKRPSQILALGMGASSLLGTMPALAGSASEAPRTPSGLSQTHPGEAYSQYYRRRRGPSGGAVAAGVIGGLAAGALIGGLAAQAQPAPGYGGGPGAPVGNVYGQDPNYVAYCAARYRSFDPVSGTYLARDGYRYPCE